MKSVSGQPHKTKLTIFWHKMSNDIEGIKERRVQESLQQLRQREIEFYTRYLVSYLISLKWMLPLIEARPADQINPEMPYWSLSWLRVPQ